MTRPDLREAALRGLQGDLATNQDDLRRAYGNHRAIVAKRPTWTSPRTSKASRSQEIATLIRAKILSETGLTASAGISYNKFLAKLASYQRKPNGQSVITPQMGPSFVQDLAVGRFHGIGPATSAKMNGLGIFTGLDMRNQTL